MHTCYLETELHLPYISGFLAFREVDPLMKLLAQVKDEQPDLMPQIVLVDGNGILHPRMCGIACHLGIVANIPTIGVAKSFLVIPGAPSMKQIKEKCRQELMKRGDHFLLSGSNDITFGAALRTTDAAPNPVFVSQGHRVSLETCVRIVLACSRFRVPEPIRRADLDSRAHIRHL